MIAFLPIVVTIVGALVYGLFKDKASELGRIAFGCGLLAVCFQGLGPVVGLLGGS